MGQRTQPAEQVDVEARDADPSGIVGGELQVARTRAGAGTGTGTGAGAGAVIVIVAAVSLARDRYSGVGVDHRELLRALDVILLARGGDVGRSRHQVAIVDQRFPNQRLKPRVAEDVAIGEGGEGRLGLLERDVAGRPLSRDRRVRLPELRLESRAAGREQREESGQALQACASLRRRMRSRSAAIPSRTDRRTSTKKNGM